MVNRKLSRKVSLQKTLTEVARQRAGLSQHVLLNEAVGLAGLEGDNAAGRLLHQCVASPRTGAAAATPLQLCAAAEDRADAAHVRQNTTSAAKGYLHDLAKYPSVLRENLQWVRFLSGAKLVSEHDRPKRRRLHNAACIPGEVLQLLTREPSAGLEAAIHEIVADSARHVYAIEEGQPRPPVVILKQHFEGIIPRDQARDVINGAVQYLLVDETGVRMFRVGEVEPHREERLRRASQWAQREVSETYVAVEAYTPDDDVTGGISLKQGQRVEVLDTSAKVKRQRLDDDELDLEAEQLLDNSAARHRMSVRPPRRHASPRRRSAEETRWLVRVRPRTSSPPAEGLVPASVLRPEGTSDPAQGAAPETPRGRRKTSRQAGSGATEHLDDQRAAVVRELLETEEEFVKDTQYIMENYYHHLDSPSVPRELREKKEALFGNFRELCQFHQRELLEGIKYYADKPLLIGKTFLRLAPDFDKHAIYCRDEPAAQTLLETDKLLAHHFQEHAAALHDDKALSDHLRLPIQRINDYQLLLKDLVQLSSALREDCSDLQRALEFIISVPHRAHDLKFINSIEGFRGNIHRLGRLILHDWFTETESDGVAKQRYLFLFKTCVLVSKPRKVGETKSVFQLKDIIRLSGVKLSDSGEERAFTFHLRAGDTAPYPVRLEAKTSAVKEAWLEQLHALLEEHAREPETSEVHEDDLSVVPSSSEHVEDEEEFVTAPVADGTTEEDPTEPSRTPRPSITSPLPSISENPAEKRDSIGETAERKTSVSETAGERESVTESKAPKRYRSSHSKAP
ncbi:Obscurin [Amphibalanus amphitrite]|uniref:Obscurin n=1 Tax=Amphibalanus amphitrite TaxID=1232801 RepID=A0A6A4X9S6_AMPAM|nr:Obscurin [Amphibalanus amphitrite]